MQPLRRGVNERRFQARALTYCRAMEYCSALKGQAITELGSLTDAITGTDVTSQITGPSAISFIGNVGSFSDTFTGISRHVSVTL
jgi:hypothetical protein